MSTSRTGVGGAIDSPVDRSLFARLSGHAVQTGGIVSLGSRGLPPTLLYLGEEVEREKAQAANPGA